MYSVSIPVTQQRWLLLILSHIAWRYFYSLTSYQNSNYIYVSGTEYENIK